MMPETTSLRWVGIELSPARRRSVDPSEVDAMLGQLQSASPNDARRMPRVDPGALAVFRDAAGDEYVMLPAADGPALVPYLSGSPLALDDDRLASGGFLSSEALQAHGERLPKPGPEAPTPRELRDSLIESLAAAGMVDQAAWSRARRAQSDVPPPGANTDSPGGEARTGSGSAAETSGAAAGSGSAAPESSGGRPGIWDSVRDEIPTMAAEQFGAAALGGFLSGDGLKPSALLGGASGLVGAIGTAVLMGHLQRHLMKGLDDESSTAEWAVKTVGPQVAAKVFGMGNFGLYFGGESPYESPALRVCDPDNKANSILEGCCSVLIEGMPAARVGDTVDKAGVNCKYGAREVQIGGPAAARVDLTPAGLGYGTQSQVDSFLMGAARTLIGGPTNRPASDPPPIPAQWSEEATGIPHDQTFPHTPNDTRPENTPRETAGYSFDETKGEWIMWHPDRGWSTTLQEHSRVSFGPEWFLQETSWKPETGVWVLGSPEWPGAGTAGSWWVPDRLWSDGSSLDMHSYWGLHDWLFGPGHPNVALDPWQVVQVEWAAFTAGMNWNPLRWGFQLIYSGATTIAAAIGWWDNFAQELDHLAGFPGHYEYRERLRPHRHS